MESIPQPVCASIMEMGQNMLLCFTNIVADILHNILCRSFPTKRHILAGFHQMQLPLKSLKTTYAKAALI
jgi:hypothetical protein